MFPEVIGFSESSFKEVSGLSMEMGVEEIAEGGVNGYKHRVPTTAKFSNLILKRGMVTSYSGVAQWCFDTLEDGLEEGIDTKTIVVNLLDESGLPLKSWVFVDAWPVKWAVSDLNSMNNEIAIETLEFAYSYFKVISLEAGVSALTKAIAAAELE